MPDAFIFDAVRTPRGRGKSDGSLYIVRPVDLLVTVLRALQERNQLDTQHIDDIMVGCVTQTGEQGACIGRFASLEAGYHVEVPSVSLNRFCGSGLDAVNYAAAMIMAGMADLTIAGGVEHMSRVAMGSDGGPWWDAAGQWSYGFVPQGISADLMATLWGFSREDVDHFALDSQHKAAAAVAAGAFNKSLVPVRDVNGLVLLDHDEHPRPEVTLEALGKLRAAFATMGEKFGMDALTKRRYPQVDRIEHVHTAGNSSGIVDGAAAILLGSQEKGAALGLKPRARVRSMAVVAQDPLIMLTGPVPATQKALRRAGMEIGDIDLVEVNEAFAVVPMFWLHEMGVAPEKLNITGGAIALGHPLGATGAVILNTLLDNLEAQDLNTGLATLCTGGGMGIATIIERV